MSITVKLSPHPLNPTRLEQTLIHMGSSLIRVKGYVKSSDGYLYLFQGSGERFVWRPTLLSTHPYLVFIGLELDREYIEHEIFHPV
nr:GTP-binding protein [Paenibacillus shirakamiensis]